MKFSFWARKLKEVFPSEHLIQDGFFQSKVFGLLPTPHERGNMRVLCHNPLQALRYQSDLILQKVRLVSWYVATTSSLSGRDMGSWMGTGLDSCPPPTVTELG